jgi:hypothetical protein
VLFIVHVLRGGFAAGAAASQLIGDLIGGSFFADKSGVRHLLRSLDRLDSGLRWALIPIGIIASLVVSGIVDAAFAAAAGRSTNPGEAQIATTAFIAAATRTLFPAILSPKPWPVGIVMFVLDFLLRAGLPAYRIISYEYIRLRAAHFMTQIAADVIAGIAGGVLGLYLVRRASAARKKQLE